MLPLFALYYPLKDLSVSIFIPVPQDNAESRNWMEMILRILHFWWCFILYLSVLGFFFFSLVFIGRVFNLLLAGEPCLVRERPCQSKQLPYRICVKVKLKCWTCVEEHLDGKERGRARYNVSGLEYCVTQFQCFVCSESCSCNVM